MKRVIAYLLTLLMLVMAASAESAQEQTTNAELTGAVLEALGQNVYAETWQALLKGETVAKGTKGAAAKGVQLTLIAFGKGIDADGIAGSKTIAALNEVQTMFGLETTDSVNADVYAALLLRLLIIKDPDTATALMGDSADGEFEYAMACALCSQGCYYQARQLFDSCGWGDGAQRAADCIRQWPDTGVLRRNSMLGDNEIRLTVSMEDNAGRAAFVRIMDGDGNEAAALFIQETDSADVRLPAGNYQILVATGDDWYGAGDAFGDKGRYEVMVFGENESSRAFDPGYSYTLTFRNELKDGGEGVGSADIEYADFLSGTVVLPEPEVISEETPEAEETVEPAAE